MSQFTGKITLAFRHLWSLKHTWNPTIQLLVVMARLPEASSSLKYELCHQKTCLRGFMIRVDSNRPAQPKKLGRCFKFRAQKLEVLYYIGSEQQRRWSDCADAQGDLRLCCSHMAKTGFLITWLILCVWTVKALAQLCRCAGSPEPSLFACDKYFFLMRRLK